MGEDSKPPYPPITKQQILWVGKKSLPLAGCLFSPVLLVLAVAVAVVAFASRGALRSWLDHLPSRGADWNWLGSFPFRTLDWHWLTAYLWQPFGWHPVPWVLGLPLLLFLSFFLLRRPLAYISDVLGIVFKETGEILRTSSSTRLIFATSLSVCLLLFSVSIFLGIAYATLSSAVYYVAEQLLPRKRRADQKEQTIKQLRDSIVLTPLAMSSTPAEDEFGLSNRYRSITVECSFLNASPKTVTAFSGMLEGCDLPGEPQATQRVEAILTTRPREGKMLKVEFPDWPRDSWLATVPYEDVKWEWHPLKATFEDGTTLEVEDERIEKEIW